MEKLWVIPASDDIATKNIPLSLAEGFPSGVQEKVEEKGFQYDFAWGAKLGAGRNVRLHSQMKRGDYCLFYTADQQAKDERVKAYRWIAKIEETTNDAELAKNIWHPAENGEHFSLIYFLASPVKIYLEPEELASLLTPKGDYFYAAPRGFSKVDREEAIDNVVGLYGSIKGLAYHILRNHSLESPPEKDYSEFYDSALGGPGEDFVFSDDLLKPNFRNGERQRKAAYTQRRSSQSKKVGDEAEQFVFEVLSGGSIEDVKKGSVKNVASEKVGWDVEYERESGGKVRVEVKGTVGKNFLNFEITHNELVKLKESSGDYHIYLVAGCRSGRKMLQIIDNIRELMEAGKVSCSALTYRVELLG